MVVVSLGKSTSRSKLTYDGLFGHYKYYYKTRYFPKQVKDETVPEADKAYVITYGLYHLS